MKAFLNDGYIRMPFQGLAGIRTKKIPCKEYEYIPQLIDNSGIRHWLFYLFYFLSLNDL